MSEPRIDSQSKSGTAGGDMNQVDGWIGSVWSHRRGRLLIGKLRTVQGNTATLSVVGLGPVVPEGVRVLPPEPTGSSIVQVSLLSLVAEWKRMGRGSGAGGVQAIQPSP
jgi:hypothetical protein